MRQHLQQFSGFSAVRQQQAHVLRCNHPEVAVQGIGGVEEQGHQADRRKSSRNLSGHDAAFADAGDHQLRFAIGATLQQRQGSLHLLAIKPIGGCGNRC